MKKYIKDILNMEYNDFIKFTKKENVSQFQTILSEMSKEANKRIGELKSSNIGRFSPAYTNLREQGIYKFKPYKKIYNKSWDKKENAGMWKDKRNQLLEEFSTMKQFLEAKSSTLSGWNQIRSKISKRLGTTKMFKSSYSSKRSANYWMKKEEQFWKLYNKLVDELGGLISQLDSKRVQKMLSKISRNRHFRDSDEDIQLAMRDYLDALYDAKEKRYKLNDAEFIENEVRLMYGK